jgi:hypothetical protein
MRGISRKDLASISFQPIRQHAEYHELLLVDASEAKTPALLPSG